MPSYIATKNVWLGELSSRNARVGDQNASFSFSYMVCHIVVAGNRTQRPTQTTLKNCGSEKIFKQPYNAPGLLPSCRPCLSLIISSSIPHPDALGASSPALWAGRKTKQAALQAHPVTTRYKAMIPWPLETYGAAANKIACRRS